MKFLSKTALPLLAALALTCSAASAQTAPAAPQGAGQHRQHTPQQMAQHQTKKLSQQLGLNSQQSAQVQQIMQQRAQDMQAMRASASASPDRQQLHAQMKASRAKYDAQLQGVLTPEQFGKYTTMRREHHHGQRPGGKQTQPKTTQS